MKNDLVCGVGINDYMNVVNIKGKTSRCYTTWNNMLKRCYSIKSQHRNPTYVGCTVCEEWLSFSNFKKWFDENYVDGFDLDKDILVEGNKEYSPEFCRFVPHYLNTLICKCDAGLGKLPIGITKRPPRNRKVNTTYTSRVSNGYSGYVSKNFKTIEEAQAWYSETKARVVKEQAVRAFLDNAIKTDVYLALVRRKF